MAVTSSAALRPRWLVLVLLSVAVRAWWPTWLSRTDAGSVAYVPATTAHRPVPYTPRPASPPPPPPPRSRTPYVVSPPAAVSYAGAASRFRLAIVLAGEVRSFAWCLESIAQHVVHPHEHRGVDVHMFAFISIGDEAQRQLALGLLAQLNSSAGGLLVAADVRADEPLPDLPERTFRIKWEQAKRTAILQQMLGWRKGYDLVVAAEQQLGSPYDMVARIRTDMVWFRDVPDVTKLPHNLPTLPRAYTTTPAILRGCIDDKIIFLPRSLSHGFFHASDLILRGPTMPVAVANTTLWTGLYDLLTDSMLCALGWSVQRFGSRHESEVESCGDGLLAPFHYAEFAANTLRPGPTPCFENFMADAWSGYSGLCPGPGATSLALPPGTALCHDQALCGLNSLRCQACPPHV